MLQLICILIATLVISTAPPVQQQEAGPPAGFQTRDRPAETEPAPEIELSDEAEAVLAALRYAIAALAPLEVPATAG